LSAGLLIKHLFGTTSKLFFKVSNKYPQHQITLGMSELIKARI
jgi:hypothetical protein